MSDEYGRDFDRILSGDDLLGGGTPRPVSRREQIAAMREQARAAERQRKFRTGLVALAAVAAIVAGIIVIVVAGG